MAEWKTGQTILNEYLIEKELGRGGMGRVWLVKSNTTKRQFAVKQTLLKEEKHRKAFLTELQTWIDLPAHPNIVPCRFFRTVGDEIVIFADYIEGGSLADWIAKRKLTTLEQILDVAIQFAWGLHAIHERGLIHQDVKPANVLMTADGVPMVADFGLARARMRAADGALASPAELKGQESVLVSSGGLTPAYASPEQHAGQPLSRKTDIWSWGVSVLDIFTGGVSCPHGGHIAAEVLEAFIETTGDKTNLPTIPLEVAELLEKCFSKDPDQRWQDLDIVVRKLEDIYGVLVGVQYNRTLAEIKGPSRSRSGTAIRQMPDGTRWPDPREWLERALQADGRVPADAAEIVARHVSSRRGQMVDDIAVYDEARQIYERLAKGGRKEIEKCLAALCFCAALLHETTDNSSGALTLYDRAIEIHERLADDVNLAANYMNKANLLSHGGENRTAVSLYDHAIAIRERLVKRERSDHLEIDLAMAYGNKATATKNLGDNKTAVRLYDQAITILNRLANDEWMPRLARELAILHMGKGLATMALGDNCAAVPLFDRAIDNLARLVECDDQSELRYELAKVYVNKGNALRNCGNNLTAAWLYDQAIVILNRLVTGENRYELSGDLAMAYQNKGAALMGVGDHKSAVPCFDSAITIYERRVKIEGCRDLTNDLARAYTNKAIAVDGLGNGTTAEHFFDMAIRLREHLVNIDGRRELAYDLAMTYMNKATTVMGHEEGNYDAAVALYARATTIFDRLVYGEGQTSLTRDMAKAYYHTAVALNGLGNYKLALIKLDRAIGILESFGNEKGGHSVIIDLGNSFINKAIAFHGLGNEQTAIECLDRSITLLGSLANAEGMSEMNGVVVGLMEWRSEITSSARCQRVIET